MACFASCFGFPKRAPVHDDSAVYKNPLVTEGVACSELKCGRKANSVCERRASATSAWVATNLAEDGVAKTSANMPDEFDPVVLAGAQLRSESSTAVIGGTNSSEPQVASLSPNTPTIIAPNALRAAANRPAVNGLPTVRASFASVSAPVFKLELPADEAWVPAPKLQLLQHGQPEAALAPLLLVENEAALNSALELGDFYESMLLSMQIRLKADAELSSFRQVPSMGSNRIVTRLSMGQNPAFVSASANVSGAQLAGAPNTSNALAHAERRFLGTLDWSAPPVRPGSGSVGTVGSRLVPSAAVMAAMAAAADSSSSGQQRSAGRAPSSGFEFVPHPYTQPYTAGGPPGGRHRGVRRNNSNSMSLSSSSRGRGERAGGARPLQAAELASGPAATGVINGGSAEAALTSASVARRSSAASGLSSGPGDAPGTEGGGGDTLQDVSTMAQLISDEPDDRPVEAGGAGGMWQDLDQVPLEAAVDVASGATLVPPMSPPRPRQVRARSAVGAAGTSLHGAAPATAAAACGSGGAGWEGLLGVEPSQDLAAAVGADASQWQWPRQWHGQSPPQTPPPLKPQAPYSLAGGGGGGVASSVDSSGADGGQLAGGAWTQSPSQQQQGGQQAHYHHPHHHHHHQHHHYRGGHQHLQHQLHHHHHHHLVWHPYSTASGSGGGRTLRPIPEAPMDPSSSAQRQGAALGATASRCDTTTATCTPIDSPPEGLGSAMRLQQRLYESPSLKPQQHVLMPHPTGLKGLKPPKLPSTHAGLPLERSPPHCSVQQNFLFHLQPVPGSSNVSPTNGHHPQQQQQRAGGLVSGPRRQPSSSKLAPALRSSSWYGGAPPVHPHPNRISPEVPVEMRLCHGAQELFEGVSDVRPLEVDGGGGGGNSEDAKQQQQQQQVATGRPAPRPGGLVEPRGLVGGWMPETAAGSRHGAPAGTGCRSVVLQGRWQGQPVGVKLIFGSELDPRNSGLISAVAAAAAVHSSLVRVYGIRLLPAGAVTAAECRKLAIAAEAAGEATAAAVSSVALRPGEGVLAVLMEFCSMGSLDPLARAVYSPFRPNRSWPAYLARRALLRTALEVAGALAHLHRYGLGHGALRPSNVLLVPALQDRRNFCAKVADVGLSARVLQLSPAASLAPLQIYSGANGSNASANDVTMHFTAAAAALALAPSPAASAALLPVLGKTLPAAAAGPQQQSAAQQLPAQLPLRPEDLLFVAPEALREPGRLLASPPADVFAFGMFLWVLAAGQTGWPPELLLEEKGGKGTGGSAVHRSIPTWPTGSHPQLRDLYETCVSSLPEQRPTMDQVVQELTQLDEGLRSERPKTRAAAAASYAALAAAGAARGGGGGNFPPGFML